VWSFSDFFDYLTELDWIAAIVGAVAVMVLGLLWYGPLFGKQWSAGTGVPMASGMPPTPKLISTAVYSIVFNVGIAYTFGAADDIEHALVLGGLVIGVLLIGSMMYSQVVWEGRKTNVYLIDLLYVFLAGAVAIYVQGLIV